MKETLLICWSAGLRICPLLEDSRHEDAETPASVSCFSVFVNNFVFRLQLYSSFLLIS